MLAEMTWPEVDEPIGRGAGVFLPVGATEQHGYHLPLATDVLLPTELALAVADEHDFLVAPPVSYGYRSRPLSGGGQGSLMLHLRPDLVVFDRAVDDASRRHPWYDVVPPPEDFVPASGTLWKATQASGEKGRITWEEIVGQFRSAISMEFV